MFWSDNPHRDADRHMEQQEKWLESRPVCSQCGEHIQEDEAYRIGNDLWCEQCIADSKVSVENLEDYIE